MGRGLTSRDSDAFASIFFDKLGGRKEVVHPDSEPAKVRKSEDPVTGYPSELVKCFL